jgi:2-(1,2-epoxy-1,2-dihydrophenyl)acetyl-CoA isomerase
MTVRVEQRDFVATVTLDWPGTRNALTLDRIAEVSAAIAQAALGGGARCLILTGSGAFCAGADLHAVAARHAVAIEEREREIRTIAQSIVRTLVGLPIPTIAAVDGPAIGLGLDMALACDCMLIGPDGWLMQGWGRVGVIPGTGGELLLRMRNPRLIWRLLAEQRRIRAADAERWNIGEAVTGRSALDAAAERAHQLARLPLPALTAYVELNREQLRARLSDHLDRCAAVQARLLGDSAFPGRAAAVLTARSGSD